MGKSASAAYTGAYLDNATGAYPLGNGYRWYLPGLMRFSAPDSMSPFGAGGVSPYVYCGADPINHADPSGHVIEFSFDKASLWVRSDVQGKTIEDVSISQRSCIQDAMRAGDGAGPSASGAGGALSGSGDRVMRKRPAPSSVGDGGISAKRSVRAPANPEQFDVAAFMASEMEQGHIEWHGAKTRTKTKIAATWHAPTSRLPYPPQVNEAILNRIGFVRDASSPDAFSLGLIDTEGRGDMQDIYFGTHAPGLIPDPNPVSGNALYGPMPKGRRNPELLSQAQLAANFEQAFADRLIRWNPVLPVLGLNASDFS